MGGLILAKRITKDEFLERLHNKYGDKYKLVGDYQGYSIQVEMHCNICNQNWDPIPYNLIAGHGCRNCAIKARAEKSRVSFDDFIKRFFFESCKRDNPYIYLYGYTNMKARVRAFHLKCMKPIWIVPDSFINGHHGCPICHGTPKLTIGEFKKQLSENNIKYALVGKYKGKHHKTDFYCPRCKQNFPSDPASILSGEGCPRCANYWRSIHHKKDDRWLFKQLVKTGVYKEYFPAQSCKGSHAKIYFVHLRCGQRFPVTPNHLLRGSGCPICNKKGGSSKSEKYIIHALDKLGIKYEYQKYFDGLKDKQKLSYDFYLPNANVLIEYNGEQHYRPVNYFGGKSHFLMQQQHDRMKQKYAEDHGYTLINIPYMVHGYKELYTYLSAILNVYISK